MDQKELYVIYKAIINDEGYNGYAMLFHHCEDIKILGYTDTKEKAERTVRFLRHDPTRDIISDDKFWNKKEQKNVFYFYQKTEELVIDDCHCYNVSGIIKNDTIPLKMRAERAEKEAEHSSFSFVRYSDNEIAFRGIIRIPDKIQYNREDWEKYHRSDWTDEWMPSGSSDDRAYEYYSCQKEVDMKNQLKAAYQKWQKE